MRETLIDELIPLRFRTCSPYCKTMIPWHLKEARRDINNGNICSAEIHVSIAEQMVKGDWFQGVSDRNTIRNEWVKPPKNI